MMKSSCSSKIERPRLIAWETGFENRQRIDKELRMREFVNGGKRFGKNSAQWIGRLIILGLLGFSQIQCSEGPSQAPSAITPTDALTTVIPQPSMALASDSPPVVTVSTPLLASNERFIKVSKDAMASVVNISATTDFRNSKTEFTLRIFQRESPNY